MAKSKQSKKETSLKPKKVLLVGPHRSGKSSLIRSMVADSVCVEHDGSSISLDFGCLVVGEKELNLFGVPGRRHFQFMAGVLGRGADICVLVVDSADPKSFDQARVSLSRLVQDNTAVLVAANKQDLPKAMRGEQLGHALEVGKIPVVEVSAQSREGTDRLLQELVSLMDVR